RRVWMSVRKGLSVMILHRGLRLGRCPCYLGGCPYYVAQHEKNDTARVEISRRAGVASCDTWGKNVDARERLIAAFRRPRRTPRSARKYSITGAHLAARRSLLVARPESAHSVLYLIPW